MAPIWVAFCLTLRAGEPGQPPYDFHLAVGGYGRTRPIYFHYDLRQALPAPSTALLPPPGVDLAPMRSFLVRCR